MQQTLFFYDLETSGLDARTDRIMQFAGQRTNLQLEPLGEPVNLLVKLPDDTLPSPYAINVTKITPQSTQQDGLTEAELCRYLQDEIFIPQTVALGYNTVRFDDEFIRHLFWRNFYDPYEWQWADGRSRWDLLDVVRLTRALRPEGIEWPFTPEGKPTNRLELLTKLNGISHEHAHDALSDVYATIAVAKLIKEKQPQLYDFLFKARDKREVQKLVNLDHKKPFVYASGRYSNEFNKATVAFPIAPGRNGRVLVYDLRYNLDEMLEEVDKPSSAEHKDLARAARSVSAGERFVTSSMFPKVKGLAYNKCPAVAPMGVLEAHDGWRKIGLTPDQVQANLKSLLAHPEFAERMRTENENKPEWPAAIDPESALYDAFLPDQDRITCNMIHNATANQLADLHPNFLDERLPELLLHYKARNFATALSESEVQQWEQYRQARLQRQQPSFVVAMEKLSADPATDDFVLTELQLWYQSLASTDY